MNKISDLDPRLQNWIEGYLNQTISKSDFESLQKAMLGDPELRHLIRRYLNLDCHLVSEGGLKISDLSFVPWSQSRSGDSDDSQRGGVRKLALSQIGVAAAIAFLLGALAMYWQDFAWKDFANEEKRDAEEGNRDASGQEQFAEGFAVIKNLIDVTWGQEGKGFQIGEILGAETLHLAQGKISMQFFSGAILTLEGPAKLSLNSSWKAYCEKGALRLKVPPAARGFKLQTPATEIEDLGTEFGFAIQDGKEKLEVFDGEVLIRPDGRDTVLVQKGNAIELSQGGLPVAITTGEVRVPNVEGDDQLLQKQIQSDFEKWESYRDELCQDQRLVAFYDFRSDPETGLVPNLCLPRNAEFDGAIVLGESVSGRWPDLSTAIEFKRPSSRVRVNLTTAFSAFTFMSWVRVDSLDRQYNGLLMADGYETGEPHWQIRKDGRMMLSVMVDESKENPYRKNARGFHRVYFSPPIWDLSMSGQWLHLASTFDPEERRVVHFLNGKVVSVSEIEDDYVVRDLRIGNAEIGNWGHPFREDPVFAIRNLNGRMDELAIFNAALGSQEIEELFKRSHSRRR